MTRLTLAHRRWLIIVLVGLATAIADQLTKLAAVHFLIESQPIYLLGRIVRLTLSYNTGMILGLPLKGALFFVVAATIFAMVIFLLSFSRKLADSQADLILPLIAAGLMLGGAIGNITDRIRLGAVVDFVGIGFWPIFNLADSAATAAVILFIWHLLIDIKSYDRKTVETD